MAPTIPRYSDSEPRLGAWTQIDSPVKCFDLLPEVRSPADDCNTTTSSAKSRRCDSEVLTQCLVTNRMGVKPQPHRKHKETSNHQWHLVHDKHSMLTLGTDSEAQWKTTKTLTRWELKQDEAKWLLSYNKKFSRSEDKHVFECSRSWKIKREIRRLSLYIFSHVPSEWKSKQSRRCALFLISLFKSKTSIQVCVYSPFASFSRSRN